MKLVVSAAAGRDLDSIYDYTRGQWGEEQADRYVHELWDAFSAVARDPGRGLPATGSPAGYRRLRQGSHFIFYRIRADVLRVERVLHVRMHAVRHLS
ncbi:MAG: type II toxin-antitoxin system RelE/ParE family toxin [Sphingomonas sp.]|uniref:type II toxin-antitoxin system RelE/ParE family toxin n=1 Tax=Sphingomonas sp. TaxID=28214 RepID=UPI001AFD0624|nr:type II toxin-antitoxin system RelE/ParE family toxin [Sphingomonas sp.]MBO9622694.1 type II toxin-antitoxin system RelE/ParE family toxin [Sphingomonas sp.]